MVGPRQGEWTVLRQTDGERFVVEINIFDFVRNSCDGMYNCFRNEWVPALEIIRRVIIYPLVRELFAFAIRAAASCKSDQIHTRSTWTTSQLKSSCKNSVDDYNATPLLEGNDCQEIMLKFGNLVSDELGGYSL